MSNVFSEAAILEKNKLASDIPFLVRVQVDYTGIDTMRFARNTEDIVWRGQSWQRFPVGMETSGEDGKTIPQVTLKLSNCGGLVQQYVQTYNGFAGATVKIFVVLASNLSNSTPEFELDFLVTETRYDEQWIAFVLGANSELSTRFPRDKYLHDYCRWTCGDIRCGYTDSGKCVNNLKSCLIPERFGGEPGMGSGR